MTYRGEGAGRKEEAGRVIRREVPIELAPVAPAPDPPRRRRPWREFVVTFVVTGLVLWTVGYLFGGPPSPRPARTAPWMNRACGTYGPALTAVLESDINGSRLYSVTCQMSVQITVEAP